MGKRTVGDEEQLRELAKKKREVKDQSMRLQLERMNKAELERGEKQTFQAAHSNLLVVTQVRLYKQVKNDLFNWSQLLNIVSSIMITGTSVFLIFIILSIGTLNYPFVMSIAVSKETENRYESIKGNYSLLYIQLINLLSVLITLIIIGIGFALR